MKSPSKPLYIVWSYETSKGQAKWKDTGTRSFWWVASKRFYALSQMWWWWNNNLPFFAQKESVRLACRYHHVVLMECTYKTNKYRSPLFHIVGVTLFNSQFSVGFCFLKEEKQNDYMWALSKLATILTPETRPAVIVIDRELSLIAAIDKVFPSSSHLLCIWHINKNIMSKCKRQFETSEEWNLFLQQWNILVAANTKKEII